MATVIALAEISIPMPRDDFISLKMLSIIHPEPVPTSSMYKFLFLKIFITFSQSSSVSGLGIKVFLFTKKSLLQNSLFFRIYARGSLLALRIISFLKLLAVFFETSSFKFINKFSLCFFSKFDNTSSESN